MRIARELNSTEVQVLERLRDIAIAERGWRRRGVRGWMFYEEVWEAVGGRISEVLPRLARRGLVERTDVREEGLKRPVWLHRITDAGLRRLAMEAGGGYRPISTPRADDPDAGSFYLLTRDWLALVALRTAGEEGGPLRFGEPGWLTPREVAARADDVPVAEGLAWLHAHGFATRRALAGGDGAGRRAWAYCATERGRRATRVDSAPHAGYGQLGLVQVKCGGAAAGAGGER